VKPKLIDLSKRKFIFASALALGSFNLASLRGATSAKDSKKETNMTLAQLEDRLNAKIAAYDLQIERLKAVTAIQNCMARYETYHLVSNEIANTPECFALWRDDVTVEISSEGVLYGPKNVENYWKSMAPRDNVAKKGCIFFHTLATPCIQVAGDGKTAKVTWASPGFEADCGKNVMDGSDHMAVWCWGKYGVDFIKNPKTGEWKIWHQRWFRTTRNDYHLDFVEFARKEDEAKAKPSGGRGGPGGGQMPPGGAGAPGGAQMAASTRLPTIFHGPLSGEVPHHPFPIDPSPYETYNGDFRWIYGGAEREKLYGVKYLNYEKYFNVNYANNI
jgi:hypothetical protein